MREYKRDKRSPIPKNTGVSKVMSAIRAKNTKPEKILRQALYAKGIKGYRLNFKKVPGRPDIAFVSKRLAIFVNGCFWHRCPNCNLTLPKHNNEFWKNKFDKNVERDKRKVAELQTLGWKVLTIWECEISNKLATKILQIEKALAKYIQNA